MHESWLQDFLVFFAAAGIVVPIFHRARLGAVLGFLLVGVLVGPYALGRLTADYPWLSYLVIEDRARVEPFGELGVMFLLFIVGLELSLARLWSLRRLVLGVGGVQFAVSVTVVAAVLLLVGMPGEPAIVVGLALAMSSTAIVMQLLEEQGRSATAVGRLALSVLLFQDLMVAPALFVTGILGSGNDHLAWSLALALGQAALAIALIVIVGRFALRPLLHFTAKTGSRETMIAIMVLIIVAVAAGTGLAGLSTALGAFLAGLLVAETEYRHQLEIDLAPFKGLLVGVFFVSVGMSLDLAAVWRDLALVAMVVAALCVFKAIILFGAARAFGQSLAAAAETALLLAQAGEFAFIIVNLARGSGLLSAQAANSMTAIAVLSMIATPLLALVARRLGARLQRSDHRQDGPSHDVTYLDDHVVIGGFGRVGQMVAKLLEAENIRYVALDTDAEIVRLRKGNVGGDVYFGDASRREMMSRVGAEHARAFVVTLNSVDAAERMVRSVRAMRPDAVVFARVRDSTHAGKLAMAGAHAIIPEAVEASLQLGARVLESLGVPEDAVAARVNAMRDDEREKLAVVTQIR